MLEKLERKFGKYAIKGLMKYVVIVYAAGYITYLINPMFYYEWLMLDIDKVLSGQVWRIISFLIQPIESSNVIFTLLMLYVYYSLGSTLEKVWGSFRFNMFYFSGVFFNILAVVIIYILEYAITGYGVSYPISLYYLNMSMFLAFAAIFPEVRFFLMFLIPVKAKYMFIVYGVFMGIDIYQGFASGVVVITDGASLGMGDGIIPLLQSGWIGCVVTVIAIVVSLLNFILYFVGSRRHRFSPREINRKREFSRAYNGTANGRNNSNGKDNIVHPFENKNIARHKCCICGRTEKDNPDLEFRFCTKCEGNYEYCSDHIYTHQHKSGTEV